MQAIRLKKRHKKRRDERKKEMYLTRMCDCSFSFEGVSVVLGFVSVIYEYSILRKGNVWQG